MHRCTISHIDPDSPLRHAAHPGDRLVSINGNPITDVLDYKYYAYDPELAVCLRRPDGAEHTVHVSKPLGGELGLDFETYLMDNAHSCANHCVFCFIDQMPPGMRPTLYFKDDDARLSFLMGNYMTLTNLSEREVQRIIHLHISPINVSVHATDPELRSFLLGNPRAGKTLDLNLESIRNELRESGEQRGAFVCEYAVFKEIFNLQMRNLERLGSTMFLAVIMVSALNGQAMEPIKQDNIMSGLLEILKQNLRKGDTITHFSPTIFALLLPSVNYTTGNMVMERVKRLFYRKYPNSNVAFNYRVGPLSSEKRTEETAQETVK